MVNLKTEYAEGLKLKNPLIVASSGITETVEKMKRAEDAGVGALVVKTLFEDPAARGNPTPMYKIIRHNLGRWRSFTFYTYEQASHFDPPGYAEEIRKAKKRLGIPIIASIACTSEEGWLRYSKLMESAGADALELNLSCPYSAHLTKKLDVLEDFVVETVSLVKSHISIPVAPKMTPQMTNPLRVAKLLERAGADGVVAFSRFAGLDIDLKKEAPVMHGGYAGHGGPWGIYYALHWLSAIYPEIKIPISGSGGVTSGEDAVKFILSGASTVQVCTAIMLEGFKIIEEVKEGLKEYMEEKGYQNIAEFRGKVCPKILSMHEVFREQTVIARIDNNICKPCHICCRVCPNQAITHNQSQEYRVREESCRGCGLCSECCPQGAISMIERKSRDEGN